MLTAEENVVLPLSIAGEKPDKAWVDELMGRIGLKDRGSHRPSELSGGQQQRVAIGRALVSRPTIVFADEPTGNLDSKTSGEILDLMRSSVDTYDQTTVMVTHDARAAAIADRILFLADGLIVKDLGRSDAHDVLAVMEELGTMTRVALKGLWGRKLRTVLTALAIVLGVAMISGTYILTDTITASFTKVVDGSYENADAVISGKVAFKNNESNTADDAGVSRRRAGEGEAPTRRRRCRGHDQRRGKADRPGRQGHLHEGRLRASPAASTPRTTRASTR